MTLQWTLLISKKILQEIVWISSDLLHLSRTVSSKRELLRRFLQGLTASILLLSGKPGETREPGADF